MTRDAYSQQGKKLFTLTKGSINTTRKDLRLHMIENNNFLDTVRIVFLNALYYVPY